MPPPLTFRAQRLEICIYVPDRYRPLAQSTGRTRMAQGRRIITKFAEPVIEAIIEEVLSEDDRKVVISGKCLCKLPSGR